MKILVVGGGVGGLSAAYYLARLGTHRVTLVEGGHRFGGWVNTVADTNSGLRFEKGPRTLRTRGDAGINTLNLAEELGLANEVVGIPSNHPSATNRLIYHDHQLHKLPSSFMDFFRKISPFSKPLYTLFIKDWFTPAKPCTDDNIYDFVARRFGDEAAKFLVSPLIAGICAGDAKEISVNLLSPMLLEAEQQYGSVIKGFLNARLIGKEAKLPSTKGELATQATNERWSVWGFREGMSTLTDSLLSAAASAGVSCHLNCSVEELELTSTYAQCRINGSRYKFDHVISSLPARSLSSLVVQDQPHLADKLIKIPFVDVVVVNLAYKSVASLNAFGHLVPPLDRQPVLGVIYDSCVFPQKDLTVLTVMMGGRWFNQFFTSDTTEEQFLEIATKFVGESMGITSPHIASHVAVLNQCIPQYLVGHSELVSAIRQYLQNNALPLSLVGSSFNGVGINDVIYLSKSEVHTLEENLL